jgi:hypothetical protein
MDPGAVTSRNVPCCTCLLQTLVQAPAHHTRGNVCVLRLQADLWPLRDDSGWGGVEAGMFSLIPASKTNHDVTHLCIVSGSGAALKDVHVKMQDHECVGFDSSCGNTTLQDIIFTGAMPLFEPHATLHITSDRPTSHIVCTLKGSS